MHGSCIWDTETAWCRCVVQGAPCTGPWHHRCYPCLVSNISVSLASKEPPPNSTGSQFFSVTSRVFGNWILQLILQPLSQAQHEKQSLEIASGATPCFSITRVPLQESCQYRFTTFSLKKGWLQMPCLLGIISGLWQPSGRKGKIPDWLCSSVF